MHCAVGKWQTTLWQHSMCWLYLNTPEEHLTIKRWSIRHPQTTAGQTQRSHKIREEILSTWQHTCTMHTHIHTHIHTHAPRTHVHIHTHALHIHAPHTHIYTNKLWRWGLRQHLTIHMLSFGHPNTTAGQTQRSHEIRKEVMCFTDLHLETLSKERKLHVKISIQYFQLAHFIDSFPGLSTPERKLWTCAGGEPGIFSHVSRKRVERP